jgi:hypothetical protein
MSLSFEIKCWKAAHLASVEGGEGFAAVLKGRRGWDKKNKRREKAMRCSDADCSQCSISEAGSMTGLFQLIIGKKDRE